VKTAQTGFTAEFYERPQIRALSSASAEQSALLAFWLKRASSAFYSEKGDRGRGI
jgi:hypothetical protein